MSTQQIIARAGTGPAGPASSSSGARLYAIALGLLAFQLLDSVVLFVQGTRTEGPPARGLLGSIADPHWLYFAYDLVLLGVLLLAARAVARQAQTASSPIGFLAFGAGIFVFGDHLLDQIVKLYQHVTLGSDPAPGLLGQVLDIAGVELVTNLIVVVLIGGAAIALRVFDGGLLGRAERAPR